MGRKNTEAWNAIHSMCGTQGIDEGQMYTRAKLVLGIYRRVCWQAIGRSDIVAEELCCYCSSDLDGALIYLETFSPDTQRAHFESRVKALFETKWMLELVDTAMLRVREFPENGTQYFEILSKCYLTKSRYTEPEMLECLHMERSRFYDRKKEAVMLFGLSLWGDAIPQLKEFLEDGKRDMEQLPPVS